MTPIEINNYVILLADRWVMQHPFNCKPSRESFSDVISYLGEKNLNIPELWELYENTISWTRAGTAAGIQKQSSV